MLMRLQPWRLWQPSILRTSQQQLRYQSSKPRKPLVQPNVVLATSTSRSPQKRKKLAITKQWPNDTSVAPAEPTLPRRKSPTESRTHASWPVTNFPQPVGDTTNNRVIGITTSDSYDTAALLQRLEQHGLLYDENDESHAVNLMGEAILIPVWAPPSSPAQHDHDSSTDQVHAKISLDKSEVKEPQNPAEIYIFESGSIVSWGLSQASLQWFVQNIIQSQDPFEEAMMPVEIGSYAQPDIEMLDFVLGQKDVGMKGDVVSLDSQSLSTDVVTDDDPDHALLVRLALSAGISRVTKLGVYEAQFEAFAGGASNVPQALEDGSLSVLNYNEVIRRVGTLHNFRQKLNLEDSNLLDEPEFLWHDDTLERLYTEVCESLEFDDRMRTLNQQVDYAFALQHDLINLISARRSHRLEVTLVSLILLQLIFFVFRG